MYQKFKSLISNDAIYTVFIVIVVALIAFALGRQSVTAPPTNTEQSAVIFKATEGSEDSVEEDNSLSIVASKSGSRYHLPSCPGAKQINEENKVYFSSFDEARSAGYLPAANCSGLD